MSEMPPRISVRSDKHWDGRMGYWSIGGLGREDTEYVRADLFAAQAAKIERLREALGKCVADLDNALRDGYGGVWSEDDFAEQLRRYRDALEDRVKP